MRVSVAPLVLMSVFGCHAKQDDKHIYSGYFTYGFEVSTFVPDGTSNRWWLNGRLPCLEPELSPSVARPILYLRVRGTLTSKGSQPTPDGYTHELNVSEVLKCRRVDYDERTPFEF